jgi:hypothetical protein
MQTFDQALLRHFQAGRVSMEDALRVATSPHDFKLLVSADGRTSTSMADVLDGRQEQAPIKLQRPTTPLPPPGVAGGGSGSAPPPVPA